MRKYFHLLVSYGRQFHHYDLCKQKRFFFLVSNLSSSRQSFPMDSRKKIGS